MALSDRIRAALANRSDLSQSGLAKACGISRASVNAWVNGKTDSIDGKYLTTAAAYLGVTAHWLSTGKGAMETPFSHFNEEEGIWVMSHVGRPVFPQSSMERDEPDNVAPAPALKPRKGIPVVGEVKGGDDGYLDELQYPVGHGDGVVEYPTQDANAYALRVRGDSMHPRYRAGEFIVVEPSIEPQPGDDVVVSMADGRKLLKELNWRRDGDVQLLSVNNHFGPLTLPESEVQCIQLVAGRVRRSAFHKTER